MLFKQNRLLERQRQGPDRRVVNTSDEVKESDWGDGTLPSADRSGFAPIKNKFSRHSPWINFKSLWKVHSGLVLIFLGNNFIKNCYNIKKNLQIYIPVPNQTVFDTGVLRTPFSFTFLCYFFHTWYRWGIFYYELHFSLYFCSNTTGIHCHLEQVNGFYLAGFISNS